MAFASKQTSNYGLCQWEQTDLVVHSDFNEDNQKIDAALKDLEDNKAEQSELDSLTSTVNGKASSSTVSSLSSRVSSLESGKASVSAVNSVAADVDALDTARLRITTGSYTGNGNKGSTSPKTIHFSGMNRTPAMLIIRGTAGMGDGLILLNGMTGSSCNLSGTTSSDTRVTVTSWTQTSISWYSNSARGCMNESGATYRYFVLG